MPRRLTGSAQDKKTTRKQKPMDAIELLKQDHEKVQELFGTIYHSGGRRTSGHRPTYFQRTRNPWHS